MKNTLAIVALSLLISSCDKVHFEFLWTDRHPVPQDVYTPPPIEQLQRDQKYFVKNAQGDHTQEEKLLIMRNQYSTVQDQWTERSRRVCKQWCAEQDTNQGLRNYWRSQGTIMDEDLEQRQRMLGIHNSKRS